MEGANSATIARFQHCPLLLAGYFRRFSLAAGKKGVNMIVTNRARRRFYDANVNDCASCDVNFR